MREHLLRGRLLALAGTLCVGSCLSTEGYYRYQDAGPSGTAGSAGSAGSAGATGSAGTAGSGTAGSGAGGRGGSSVAGSAGTSGTTGSGGSTGGMAGTVATAGRGGTTGAGGRGGTTGTAGATGTGGSGTVLFMDDFESGFTKWDFGATSVPMATTDGTKVLPLMAAGDQVVVAAGMPNWTNYSVEARVKMLSASGTSSSDGVAICARLGGPQLFYYLLINPSGDAKSLKIKLNNKDTGGSNTSLSSSLDSSGFAMNTWVTLKLEVQGNVLNAYLNGTMRGTFTVTSADQILPMGGIGLMLQNVTAEFDDVVVRALP